MRQKAALIDGFDFDIRTELDASGPVRRLRCWYPRRGNSIESGKCPTFSVGGNVIDVPIIGGHEQFRTGAYAVGDEVDEVTRERIRHSAFADHLLGAGGYPLIDEVLDLPDIRTDEVLEEHAAGYLLQHAHDQSNEIVLDVNPNDITWPYGSWEIGDDCRVVIPAGLTPWWPSGMNETRRVAAHRWKKDASGERLQVVTSHPLDLGMMS